MEWSWLRIACARASLLASSVVIGLAIGIAHVLLTPVAYRAEAVVAPVTQRIDLLDQLAGGIGFSGLLGVLPGAGGGKEAERTVATLVSNRFTYRFIQKRGLAPDLFPDRWDPETKSWRTPRFAWLPWGRRESLEPTPQELVRKFASKRSISLDRQTGLVRIRLDWSSAEGVANLVNAMIEDFNEFSRVRARTEAQEAMEYLAREMSSVDVAELRQSLARLMEEQMTREMMATVQPEFALRVVDPAVAPDRSVRPRYLMTPVLWILAAFGAAAAYAVSQARRSPAQ